MSPRPLALSVPIIFVTTCAFAQFPIDENLLRGDANNDGLITMADSVFIASFLFQGGLNPPCLDAADANDSGAVDISDMSFLNCFLFVGGMPIPRPYPLCGTDPTPDFLNCQDSSCT